MNSHSSGLVRCCAACWLVLSLLSVESAACRRNLDNKRPQAETMSRRDINTVLRDHAPAFMAIPGVAGVYVGVLDDGKTPCLKVMAVKKTPQLEGKIPKSLEGYPVVVEETGEIRPLIKK